MASSVGHDNESLSKDPSNPNYGEFKQSDLGQRPNSHQASRVSDKRRPMQAQAPPSEHHVMDVLATDGGDHSGSNEPPGTKFVMQARTLDHLPTLELGKQFTEPSNLIQSMNIDSAILKEAANKLTEEPLEDEENTG